MLLEAVPVLPKISPCTVAIDISFYDKNKKARVFVQRFRDHVNLTRREKKRYRRFLLGKDISADNANAVRMLTNGSDCLVR